MTYLSKKKKKKITLPYSNLNMYFFQIHHLTNELKKSLVWPELTSCTDVGLVPENDVMEFNFF